MIVSGRCIFCWCRFGDVGNSERTSWRLANQRAELRRCCVELVSVSIRIVCLTLTVLARATYWILPGVFFLYAVPALTADSSTTVPPRSLHNTNRKSYLVSRLASSACYSCDRKCPKSYFGVFWLRHLAYWRRGYYPHSGSFYIFITASYVWLLGIEYVTWKGYINFMHPFHPT